MSGEPGKELLDEIAASLEYPHDGVADAARAASLGLVAIDAEASAAFAELARWFDAVTRDEAEEAYTTLFDLRPTCTLHVGYHVYGEAYQRGVLLAGLVGELADSGIDPGAELPDYLPSVLRLLGRLPDDENRQLFVDRIMAVALARMQRELKKTPTPWAQAVASLGNLFGAPAVAAREDTLASRIHLEVMNNA